MTAVIEVALSWLFANAKGRDAKSFFKGPAFAEHQEPTIPLASPDCGASGATLAREYVADEGGRFPTVEWKAPDGIAPRVKEWLLVIEDPDAPLPTPIAHGIYGGIPPEKTSIKPSDLEVEDESRALLKGGFHYGKNRRSKVYMPPRPLLNHGVHRYFFQIVALSEPLDKGLLDKCPSREEVADAITGKVLGWGLWEGSCERKWQ